jgi:hypothetical protein
MRSLSLLVLAASTACFAGCSASSEASQPELAAQGARFLLAEEPAGAVGILEFREAETTKADVVLLGRIGGGKPTFSPESAEFMIVDPTHALEAGGAHECHSDNCPFCKGKQGTENAQAIISLVDEAGHVPAVDARKLLALTDGQMVVVQGEAEINSIGQLVVRARGLYIRQ